MMILEHYKTKKSNLKRNVIKKILLFSLLAVIGLILLLVVEAVIR